MNIAGVLKIRKGRQRKHGGGGRRWEPFVYSGLVKVFGIHWL